MHSIVPSHLFAECRSFRNLACSVVVLLIASNPVQAQFTCMTNSDGVSATIIGYIGTGGAINIPSTTTNGLTVTGIAYGAFDESPITSVSIANTVTNIAPGAIVNCYELSTITVASNNPAYSSLNGVLFDKIQATIIQFPEANAANPYIIPTGVTSVGDYAFAYSESLKGVTIPPGVFNIGNYAFFACTGLTNLIIPNSVTNIGQSAFLENGLISVTVSTNVIAIGSGAFSQCNSLTNLAIPASVISIGQGVVDQCAKLTTIAVDPNNLVYSSLGGVLFDKNQKTLIRYPGGAATVYTIPSGVTSLTNGAFSYCSITSVTIQYGVTNIGPFAFFVSQSLTNLTVPSSVTTIGQDAFSYCPIANLTIPDSVTSLSDAFDYGGMVDVIIGNGVTNIVGDAFFDCGKLASIIIGTNVTSIGGEAFENCSSLANVTIPNSVTDIEGSAFLQCSSLTNVTLPSRITQLQDSIFAHTGLKSITIPENVTSFADNVFGTCTNLTVVHFLGNCPSPTNNISVFSGDTYAIAYYETNATGWGKVFDGIPTALWSGQITNPPAMTPPPIGIAIIGNLPVIVYSYPGTNFTLQMTTNLASGNWVPVTNGVSFLAVQVTNAPGTVFFRLH